MKLIKLSDPGWERDFGEDHVGLQQTLYSHICNQCRCEDGITEISPIEDMLWTACGSEFDIE